MSLWQPAGFPAACWIQDIDMSCILISAMFPHIAGLHKNVLRKVDLETDGCQRKLCGAARKSIIEQQDWIVSGYIQQHFCSKVRTGADMSV